MREIKFKAFNKKYKTMNQSNDIHSIYFDDCSDDVETNDLVVHDKEEVILLQYTGLKDKYGVEIYEGDIVEVKYKNDKKFIGKIFYETRFACYMVTSQKNVFGVEVVGTHEDEDTTGIWDEKRKIYYEELKAIGLEGMYKYCEKRYKVLGNIYENPELIEEENK